MIIGTQLGVLGAQVAISLGMLYFLSRQRCAAEMRQATERHESERRLTERIEKAEQRLTEQLQGVERRLTERIEKTEQGLTERIQGVERETKTLIGDVGYLQGSMGIAPRRSESDSGEAAEPTD